jgi:hypothetical protein
VAPDGAEGPDAPLALEPEHPLVEAAGEEEGPVQAPEVVGWDVGLEGPIDLAMLVQDRERLDGGYVERRPGHRCLPR